MCEQKKSFRCFVCYLQLKSRGIIHPLLIKMIQAVLLTIPRQINKQSFDAYHNYFLLFILRTAPSGMFLLLYAFISFWAPRAGAVSHCLPLSP